MGRVVCIDFGLKRLGVAISDESRMIATPLPTIQADAQTAGTIKQLLRLLEPYTIEKIIVGYPLHMDGRVSFLADEVKHFISLLQKEVPYEVLLWDERLSTRQADRSLREGGFSRKKRKQRVDSVCALILLQSYLGY